MAYRIRVCIGALISLACLGLALYALFQLVRGGSCSSGGVHVSARQCPPGTEKWAWVLPGAIIGGLLSFFLGTFKGFGPAPEATRTRGGIPLGSPGRATGAAAPDRDPIVRLRLLRELLDAGTLSPAEFELAKAKILNEM
ncbi:SHOCT domain-containing protein [Nonomuraea sp. NPDC026600]|uniref:SHOCT domain-containing protein n=1 Tax=Nonomuraea sp. NPDC026600 TaxID=3155363 RepID=UPI0033C9569A